MNMQTQSNEKQKDDMWSIISNIAQLLGLAIPISILLGAIIIYLYLSKLGAVSLFADIISTHSSLLSITMTMSIIIMLICLIPHFTAKYYLVNIGDISSSIDKHKNWYCYSIIPAIILLMIYMIGKSWAIDKDINNVITKIYLTFIFLYPLVFAIYITIKELKFIHVKYTKVIFKLKCNKVIFKFLLLYLFYFSLIIIHIFSLVYLLFIIHDFFGFTIKNVNTFNIYLLICIVFLLVINYYFSFLSMLEKNHYLSLGILILIAIIMINFLIILNPNPPLEKLGYIEKNTDARWYLLDTRFINQNGLVKKEGTTGLNDSETLSKWKNKFSIKIPVPKVNNIVYLDLMTQEHIYRQQQKNTMYGYMAWNLGKTKIFCPHNVTIESAKKENTTLDKVCLTINGDYLQPIPDDL